MLVNPVQRYIAYYRVSTDAQGQSGLGLEAQQQAVKAYRRAHSKVLAQYTEIESGRNPDRPELRKALAHAKRSKAVLIVAKLDRLSRNAAFLLTVLEQMGEGGVVFCDLPDLPAGPMSKCILTVMAAIAELEAGVISQRTKAALAVLKARGVKLGAARPGFREGTTRDGRPMAECIRLGQKKGGIASCAKQRLERNLWYQEIRALIIEKRGEGKSWHKVADHLNRTGHQTLRGCKWTAQQVIRVGK